MKDLPEETRRVFLNKGLWVTADGRVYKPNGFDNGHLVNTIFYIIKRSHHESHKHPFAEHLRAELGNRPLFVAEVLVEKINSIPDYYFGRGAIRKQEAIEWWTYYVALEEMHGFTDVEGELFQQLLAEIGTRPVNEEGEFLDDIED